MHNASANARPRAVLYNFGGSVWGSVPSIGLVEKGYADEDVELKVVNLLSGENYSPSYLRLNPNGTVPTLILPISDTTSPEVATKFRALTDSKEILEFLDESRSQPILEAKGEQETTQIAPMLSPATIEGKAVSDALIELVHSEELDANFLLLSSRTVEEVKKQKAGIAGKLTMARVDAIKRYQSEIMAQSDQLSNPDANPRSTAQNEALLKLYSEKLQQMQPLVLTYGPSANTPATALHIQLTRSRYVKLARAIDQLENELIRGPYALGDQMSLADVHLMAWLARVMAVSEGKDGGKDLDALSAALQHECCKGSGATNRVGPKLRAYWELLKSRPSFKKVYADGLH